MSKIVTIQQRLEDEAKEQLKSEIAAARVEFVKALRRIGCIGTEAQIEPEGWHPSNFKTRASIKCSIAEVLDQIDEKMFNSAIVGRVDERTKQFLNQVEELTNEVESLRQYVQ